MTGFLIRKTCMNGVKTGYFSDLFHHLLALFS